MNVGLHATPKSGIVTYTSDDETVLIFKCTAADNSGVLEIGQRHVFASRKNRALFSKRRPCELQMRLRRRSSIPETAAANLALSKDKIGELTFYPPVGAGQANKGTAASLEAELFLHDRLFDSLLKAILCGRRLPRVELDLDSEGTLGYGRGPDGSRKDWKIENPSDLSSVNVTAITVILELFK